ncbi:hypothetical protein [Streptomyces sp. NPDC000880]
MPQPALEQRRALALACVEAIDWFHSAGLVIGDIYQANVLWSLTPEPAVHFLDCDGFRRVGRGAVQAQAGTPDWNDPLTPSTEATVDTDAFRRPLWRGDSSPRTRISFRARSCGSSPAA